MFERFTDRARRVIVLAQQEARMLNHNYIGTEHILLGLVKEGDGIAAKALESLGVSLQAARKEVLAMIGRSDTPPAGHIPFTPRAKKVLELSLREALQLGHSYIGTEHILLGLILEGEGVAAQVLQKLGADLKRVRQTVIQLLSGYVGAPREGPAGEAEAVHSELEQMEPGVRVLTPSCPGCGGTLGAGAALYRSVAGPVDEGEELLEITLVFCGRCGRTVGVLPGSGSAT